MIRHQVSKRRLVDIISKLNKAEKIEEVGGHRNIWLHIVQPCGFGPATIAEKLLNGTRESHEPFNDLDLCGLHHKMGTVI